MSEPLDRATVEQMVIQADDPCLAIWSRAEIKALAEGWRAEVKALAEGWLRQEEALRAAHELERATPSFDTDLEWRIAHGVYLEAVAALASRPQAEAKT